MSDNFSFFWKCDVTLYRLHVRICSSPTSHHNLWCDIKRNCRERDRRHIMAIWRLAAQVQFQSYITSYLWCDLNRALHNIAGRHTTVCNMTLELQKNGLTFHPEDVMWDYQYQPDNTGGGVILPCSVQGQLHMLYGYVTSTCSVHG